MSKNAKNATVNSNNNEITTKKKSRGKKIFLWIVGILLVIILALTIFFIRNPHWWNHMMALRRALFQSEEQTLKELDKIQQHRIEEVQKEGFTLNKDIEKALADNLIDSTQFREILVGKYTLEDAIAANEALSSGLITDEQYNDIVLGKITLQAALLQTQQPDVEKETQGSENNETPEPDATDNTEREPGVNADDKTPENKTEEETTPAVNEKTPTVSEKDTQKDTQKDKTPQTNPDAQNGKTDTPAKPVENGPAVNPPASSNETQTKPSQTSSEVDERIAELITRMYVLKSTYVGQIDGLVAQMKAQFVKLPPEQRTTSAKQSIATGYMSQINAMEAQCDAQVNSVVSELRTLLKNNGRDTSLADTIMSTYNSEKENTKAYYINTYGD